MPVIVKKTTTILVVLFVICLVLFLFVRVGDTNREAMFEKYGQNTIVIDDGIGGQVVYRDQGSRDAQVLFLLHGSNVSMQVWNNLIPELTDIYRVISYDQHGHGLTGPNKRKDYSATAKIETALKVLDHANVKRAVWIGNSMGGWLTWRAALSKPDRVAKMVLMDASGALNQEEKKLYLGARIARSWLGKKLAPYITPRAIIAKSVLQNYADPSKVTDELIDSYWEMARFPGNRKAIAPRVETSREPEKWHQINELKLPTLILWGEQDTVIPVSHANAFKQEIEGSEVITYPNAGHLPQEEIPVLVANDIRRWLSEDGN